MYLVMPSEAIVISKYGQMKRLQVSSPANPSKRTYRTMASAVNGYKNAFLGSMPKRMQDFDKVGIVFSGGIDSVLVAHMVAKTVPSAICYARGVKGSNDTRYARQITDRLGLKLKVGELNHQEIEELLLEIINIIEDSNSGQVEVALPVYGAVKLAKFDGMKVMLTGQAADELFGVYPWYSSRRERRV